MGALKNKLYNSLVRKNGRVWYEYERYVREHIEEHKIHRLKHLFVLLKLNWFYRVKKGNTPYMYWDVPLNPNENNSVKKNTVKASTSNVVKKKTVISQKTDCESQKYPYALAVHTAKLYAQYDYIVFNVFDTLLYTSINDKELFFKQIGEKLNIPLFSKIRLRVENELIGSAKYNNKKNDITLETIYKEMEKYTKLNYKVGVDAEVEMLEKVCWANPYIKSIFDMVSYKSDNVILVEDSIYPSEQIEKILHYNNIRNYKELIISNECKKSIADGDMFKMLEDRLQTNNIIYIDDDELGQKKAELQGFHIWKYKKPNLLDKTFYIDGMSRLTKDIYFSMIAQHMYCGQYKETIYYELGYLYYGIFMSGFISWVDRQIKKYNFKTVLLLEETSDLINNCFKILGLTNTTRIETVWITEENAVRFLVDKYPALFYEYYIDKYINTNKTVAFYLGNMDILELADKLKQYGLTLNDEISRESMYYGAFISFIEDNYESIGNIYAEQNKIIYKYLKQLLDKNENIAVVDIAGKGYVALAIEEVLNTGSDNNCVVRELTAFQSTQDYLVDNWVISYLKGDNIRQKDINFMNSEGVQFRTRNILSNVGPVFKNISLDSDGGYKFVFGEVYPWKYINLKQSQQGIIDFVREYVEIYKSCGFSNEISSEDVLRVINQLFERKDYISKAFTIVRNR